MQEKPLRYKAYFIAGCVVGAALIVFVYVLFNAVNNAQLITPPVQVCRDNDIPRAAYIALLYYQRNKQAPASFTPIQRFDAERSKLPTKDSSGKAIEYIESDIFPHIPGINRGKQRIVVGDDKSAYFSSDHYASFIQITPSCITWFSNTAMHQ